MPKALSVLLTFALLAVYTITVDALVTSETKLTASDAALDDRFGYTVAIGGDTAVIGARFDDAPASDSGSAYIFVRNGTTWTEQAKLTASDAAAGDVLGEHRRDKSPARPARER